MELILGEMRDIRKMENTSVKVVAYGFLLIMVLAAFVAVFAKAYRNWKD